MTDKYKGIVELDIAGAKRGFKFGVRAMMILAELEKIKFEDIETHLKNSEGVISTQMNFFLSGAISYARLIKIEDPTLDEVCAWVDEYGYDKLEKEAAKSMDIPNEEAPKEGAKI